MPYIKDLGKSKVEAYATEIGMLLKSIKLMRKELKIGRKPNKRIHHSTYSLQRVILKRTLRYGAYYRTI